MPTNSPQHLLQNHTISPHSHPNNHLQQHFPLNEQQQQQQQQHQQHQQQQQLPSAITTTQPKPQPLNNHVSTHDLDLSDYEDPDTDPNPPPEFTFVDILAIRKEVQCPICLGIIKKTRTVMECLHRFCRECIDKSMRTGNKECPACRTHCASRRSLRDDPRYDELIAALYPDIKKFEQEELAFYEEDESRNKQIQHNITQVIARQSEALGKKRSGIKDTAGPSTTRRRRRRRRNDSIDYQDSDDNMDANDSDKHLSLSEQHREPTPKKGKGPTNVALLRSQPLSNLSGGSLENNVEHCKEERGLSPGLTGSPEMLAWGRGGTRSTTRHGNASDSTKTSARRIRLGKLADFLRNLEESDNECMTLEVPLKNENAQLTDIQHTNGHCDHPSTFQPSSFSRDNLSEVAESLQDKFHELNRERKLSNALSSCAPNEEHMVSACQQKEAT